MLRPRILVVGDRPGNRTDPRNPLFPYNAQSAAARLAELMGLLPGKYVSVTKRVNAWHDGERLMPNGAEAKARMKTVMNEFLKQSGTKLVIIVGRQAQQTLNSSHLRSLPSGTVLRTYDTSMIVLPHTSGLCREWNDAGFRERMRETLTSLTQEVLDEA